MRLLLALSIQCIAAYLLGVMLPYFGGIGNGFELLVIPFGMAAGVLLGGWFIARPTSRLLLATLTGAYLGVVPLLIPGIAWGFQGILLPFAGTMSGFYLSRSPKKERQFYN